MMPRDAMLAAVLATLAAATDVLVVGISSNPVSLDPHRATDLVAAALVSNVCEPLVTFGPEGTQPRPNLALTWATADNRTWSFTLREGVRFHDGTPFDADAVVANVDRMRASGIFPGRAERIGPHVVALTLEQPNAALLATLSQPFLCIQSPLQLASHRRTLVGTGPFRLLRARPGLYELVANPDYWAGVPELRRLVFRRHAGQGALRRALLSGEIEVTSAVGLPDVRRLRQAEGVELDVQAGLNVSFLSINNERAPLSESLVRQALAHAIDRKALVAEILDGHGEPARNPLPPSLLGYGTRTRPLRHDVARARRLLTEAGLPDGFATTLLAPRSARPYLPDPLRLAHMIKEDLAKIDVVVRITAVSEWAAYLRQATRGDYDLALLGWQADTLDPNDFLSALLASSFIGTTNRSRYSRPEMDALLKRGRRTADPRQRARIYHQAQALFQRDLPWVPLYHASVFSAHRGDVQGLRIGPTGLLRYDRAFKQARER